MTTLSIILSSRKFQQYDYRKCLYSYNDDQNAIGISWNYGNEILKTNIYY